MGSRLRGWMESGDLAQETEREAWRSMNGKRFPNLAAFRGWLLKILRHRAANESRRRGLDLVEAPWSRLPGEEWTPSRLAAARDSGRWVRDRLQSLTQRERQVVLARVVDGESFRAIGERLAITEGNARVIFHRSLQRLREGNDDDDE